MSERDERIITSPDGSEEPVPVPTIRWSERAAALIGRVDRRTRAAGSWVVDNSSVLSLALVLAGIAVYTAVFSALSIRNYRNYGNWAYDLAIYDQAMWLVSRFGQTFMTVRGMDVWGHHVTLIAYVFAPFYRLGAGPEFLFVVQSFGLALGALPLYLIARARFGRSWVGLLFAGLYLLYAPLQNINSRDFHPEALVIAPFLFAWYCAMRKRWRWFFACLVIAMAMREDTALAVIMLGVVLAVTNRRGPTRDRDLKVAAATVALGVVWYGVATQLVIPHFNDGDKAFYLEFFYGRWGGSFTGIVENMIRHPDWVVSDAVQHDRIMFYKRLMWPLGWLPVLSPLHLLMAAPQLLASVIGDSPYARTIWYQYTAIMVAPIMIAAVEGAHRLWRFRTSTRRALAVGFLIVAAYTTNVAWSPSPLAEYDSPAFVWARANARAADTDEALAAIPDDAVVAATYNLGPHLAHRDGLYNWPNPFAPEYWGKVTPARIDCDRFPSPSVVDYIAVDMALFGPDDPNRQLVRAMTGPDGDFEAVVGDPASRDEVVVARRTAPGPDGEELPPNCSTDPATPPSVYTMLANYEADPLPTLPAEQPAGPDPGGGSQPDDTVPPAETPPIAPPASEPGGAIG